MAAPTTKLGPFRAGMDNRARDFSIPAGAVRDAVNVDIPNDGTPRRRSGRTSLIASIRTHSLWSPKDGSEGFYLSDGSLHRFTSDGLSTTLLTGLSPLARGVFCEIPGRGIAFSNGQVIKRIVDSVVKPFGIAQSQDLPMLVATTGGALVAGKYEVAVSHVDKDGEESGITISNYVDVLDGGKITVTLPRTADPAATKARIYVSARNGQADYLNGEVPIATATYNILLTNDSGKRSSTMFLMPLPAGDILAFYNGRTYSHANGILYYTEPWSGQYRPLANFIPFPEDVSIVAAMPDGLFIVADKTYFLPGTSSMSGDAKILGTLRVVAETTGVRGTMVHLPNSPSVMWFTPRGLVMAGPGGSLSFVQEKQVAVQPANEGAALYREVDGLHQVITSLRDPGVSVAGAASWFTVKMGSRNTRTAF